MLNSRSGDDEVIWRLALLLGTPLSFTNEGGVLGVTYYELYHRRQPLGFC